MTTLAHRHRQRSDPAQSSGFVRLVRLVPRILLAAVLLGVAVFSIGLSRENIRYATLRDAAKLMARSHPFTTQQLAKFTAQPAARDYQSTCRTDILEPLSRLTLELASRFNQAAQYDTWSAAVGDAERLIQHRINCTPTNGDLWLRDSLLSRAISEDSQTLSRKIALAYRLAPHDAAEIRDRLRLWVLVSPATYRLAVPIAEKDVSTILHYGDRHLTGELFAMQSPRLNPLIRTELLNVSTARKTLFPLWGVRYLDIYKR